MPDASAFTADHLYRTQRIALIALLIGALGIAFAPIFVRLSEVGPVATGFWRTALATPVLALWMASESRQRGGRASRRPSSLSDYARLSLAGPTHLVATTPRPDDEDAEQGELNSYREFDPAELDQDVGGEDSEQ